MSLMYLAQHRYLDISLLSSLGFGTTGIIAGSLAALWQSVWYGAAVPARSLFACLQAAGMAGNTIIGWPLTILLTVFLIVAGLLYLAPHPDWPFDPLHRWLPGPWLNGTATA